MTRGVYRVYGLSPGEYFVRVTSACHSMRLLHMIVTRHKRIIPAHLITSLQYLSTCGPDQMQSRTFEYQPS